MTTVTSDRNLAEVADAARREGRAFVVVAPGGEPIAGVVPIEMLELLEDLADGVDATKALAQLQEIGESWVPLEELSREIGL